MIYKRRHKKFWRAGPIVKPPACYGASKKEEFLFTPLESSYHKPFKSTLLAHFERQLSNGVYPVGKRSCSFGARPRFRRFFFHRRNFSYFALRNAPPIRKLCLPRPPVRTQQICSLNSLLKINIVVSL